MTDTVPTETTLETPKKPVPVQIQMPADLHRRLKSEAALAGINLKAMILLKLKS